MKTDRDVLIEECERLRADLTALRASLQWQPIETAPRDGMPVLLYYVNPGGQSEMGMWRSEIRVGRGEVRQGWRYLRSHSATYDLDHQPTHWMPLPAPPIPAGSIAKDSE